MRISIIVPLYHGEKYLHSILEQIKKCSENIKDSDIELILYNDCPDEVIDVDATDFKYEISVINQGFNSGIHGARVHGLDYSTGQYILFMDQDDRIFPQYLASQLQVLNDTDSDAVVCEVINEGYPLYGSDKTLEKILNRQYICCTGNDIVTPGQVLIRRDAIPEFWKENVMENNGADDYFLWICMVCADKKIAINHNILFEHVIHKENASGNSLAMLDSLEELSSKVEKYEYCNDDDIEGIRNVVESYRRLYVRQRDYYYRMFLVMDKWMNLIKNKKSIVSKLVNEKIDKVVVYGKGKMGSHLEDELMSERIDIDYFIDRNAKKINDARVKTLDEIECIDVPVVVSLVGIEAIRVKNQIIDKFNVKVWTIEELISF